MSLASIRPAHGEAPVVARRLALHRAWRDVAGAELSTRLPVLERRGSCLVLAMPHATWLASLPAIAARLTVALSAHPGLRGVRRLEGRIVAATAPRSVPEAVRTEVVCEETGGDVQARWAALAARLLGERKDEK